ncbi:coiled-coil domain-containing protein 201 [Meriones unguiculatus]|uniref:coiled-coil domain-containing protein 201 n=1 Tax=Meriones unguiculatus TaxID=10047 RepID=UPI00293EA8FF|nr:coiled-coil domain-containing protein 201 [Meriones unguiculatus]
MMRPRLRKLPQRRTREEATLSCSQRPVGDALNLCERTMEDGLLKSSYLSQDIPVLATEVSTAAASRKKKPKRSREQLRPCRDLSAPGEAPSVLASLVRQLPQKRQSLAAVGCRSSPLPKVLHKTHGRKRDPMKMAAAMERVRQWESHLLQNLEEATWHRLTVETENKKPVTQVNTEDQPEASPEVHTGPLFLWTRGH